MAHYQILYWKNIPSQVKAWDDFDEVKVELAPEFLARIDAAAQHSGLTDADEYLAHWVWTEAQERPGDPADVAQAVRHELETAFDGA